MFSILFSKTGSSGSAFISIVGSAAGILPAECGGAWSTALKVSTGFIVISVGARDKCLVETVDIQPLSMKKTSAWCDDKIFLNKTLYTRGSVLCVLRWFLIKAWFLSFNQFGNLNCSTLVDTNCCFSSIVDLRANERGNRK